MAFELAQFSEIAVLLRLLAHAQKIISDVRL